MKPHLQTTQHKWGNWWEQLMTSDGEVLHSSRYNHSPSLDNQDHVTDYDFGFLTKIVSQRTTRDDAMR